MGVPGEIPLKKVIEQPTKHNNEQNATFFFGKKQLLYVMVQHIWSFFCVFVSLDAKIHPGVFHIQRPPVSFFVSSQAETAEQSLPGSVHSVNSHLSGDQNPSCLLYIGDDSVQFYRDCDKSL